VLNVDEISTGKLAPLFFACLRAHHAASKRKNGSSMALRLAFQGSGDFNKAVIAALATLGGRHGPIAQTEHFLLEDDPSALVNGMLDAGLKVPGWGSSFPLPDNDWAETERLLRIVNPTLMAKVDAVTASLGDKHLLPNPSCFTACTAICLGIPPEIAPFIFIAGRIAGWAEILSTAG
jgi:citrate synthase